MAYIRAYKSIYMCKFIILHVIILCFGSRFLAEAPIINNSWHHCIVIPINLAHEVVSLTLVAHSTELLDNIDSILLECPVN